MARKNCKKSLLTKNQKIQTIYNPMKLIIGEKK